jgi:hypothetical protein
MGTDAIQIAMQKGNINIGAHKRMFAVDGGVHCGKTSKLGFLFVIANSVRGDGAVRGESAVATEAR